MTLAPIRQLAPLTNTSFDLVVIGAGIHGAGVACEAAARGWRVALIEQGDFGHAASANSLKIIHGGFRYLQNADIVRMRQSICARRQFLKLAPHLVHPFPCIVPTKGTGMRSKLALACALTANAMVSWDRNVGLPPGSRIPAGKILSRDEFHVAVPGVRDEQISGGALWYDAFAENTERLTLSAALSARAAGATIQNYIRAEEIIAEGNAVQSVRVTDLLTNESGLIRTSSVVVAAGPWRNLLKLPAPVPGPSRAWLKSYNVVVSRPLFGQYAVGLESNSDGRKRNLFFAPWRGGTMIGTAYKPWTGNPSDFRVDRTDVEELMGDVHRVYPGSGLSIQDVTFVHGGLLPAKAGSDTPESKSRILEGAEVCGVQGLVVAEGVKYTTGLVDAAKVVDAALRHVNGASRPVRANVTFYGGGDAISAEGIQNEARSKGVTLSLPVATHWMEYGSCYRRLLDYVVADPELGRPITTDQPVVKAEVVFAVREELACRLADVVLRRTGLGSFRNPGDAALDAVAKIMAGELSWDHARITQELSELRSLYP